MSAKRSLPLNSWNKVGVIGDFNNKEGFGKLDGEIGVTLTDVEGLEFDDGDLDMETSVGKKEKI